MAAPKCPLIVFTKIYAGKDVPQMIEAAQACLIEGFDLCLRQGFAVNPENVAQALPEAARAFARAGLVLPMAEGEGNLLSPEDPTAEPILRGMDAAGVRLLKLGYFRFDPATQDYWAEVDKARQAMAGWEKLARRHHVKICLHCHMGMLTCNAATLMHVLKDADPAAIGAYIDPMHTLVEGEPFAKGAAIVGRHLCAVGLKDIMLTRAAKNDHGSSAWNMGVSAGEGLVDWTDVFATLGRLNYAGPLSLHCIVLNYAKVPPERHVEYIRKEFEFFRRKRQEHLKG